MTLAHTDSRLLTRGYTPILFALLLAFIAAGVNNVYATDFALGEHNICIVDEVGKLECATNDNQATYLPPDDGGLYTSVTSGGAHSCAIKETGDILCWGQNNFGQLDAPQSSVGFVAISASEAHTCAIDANGQAACWGLNSNDRTAVPADNTDFVAIYTGSIGSCGTKSSGITLCWSNQFPYTIYTRQDTIIDLQLPQRSNGTSCALRSNGTIDCRSRHLGLEIPNDGPYTKVGGDSVALCGLKVDGKLDCRFRVVNSAVPASNNPTLAAAMALPPLVDFEFRLEGDSTISICGLDVDGQLHCVGDNLPADRLPGEQAVSRVPSNLSMAIYSETVGELLWDVDLSGIGGAAGQFRVYRNNELVNQSFANSSYLDSDIELGVEYIYEVSYVTPGGMEGPRSQPLVVNGELSNPGNPGNLGSPNSENLLSGVMVTRYGEGSLEIFWDRPAVSVATRRYDIYRNAEFVASVPGSSFFDDQINENNAYQYTVMAVSSTDVIQAVGFIEVDSFAGLQCF